MPRQRRVGPKDVSQHVIQRGNNRRYCFTCEQDYIFYISWLKQYSIQYQVAIHAWVLMTNHVHLLCTPLQDNQGVSRMMQSLGRKYVRYFNDHYIQTGTLWEGRFKTSLVCSSDYLLSVYRYIELNPVRANMVNDPVDYKWSSYHFNAMGKSTDLCKPHDMYLMLGQNDHARRIAYRALFQNTLQDSLTKRITDAMSRELPLGDDKFTQHIEAITGEKLKRQKLGRPPKLN